MVVDAAGSVLQLLARANAVGRHVPTSPRAPTPAARVLAEFGDLPDGVDGRALDQLLLGLESQALVRRRLNVTAHRKRREGQPVALDGGALAAGDGAPPSSGDVGVASSTTGAASEIEGAKAPDPTTQSAPAHAPTSNDPAPTAAAVSSNKDKGAPDWARLWIHEAGVPTKASERPLAAVNDRGRALCGAGAPDQHSGPIWPVGESVDEGQIFGPRWRLGCRLGPGPGERVRRGA